MGYFAQPNESGAMPGRAAALSTARLEAAMDSQDWHYETTESGDLHGSWDEHVFDFMRGGPAQEILIIRGRWEARPPISLDQQMLVVLNDWHRDHLFPKGYVVDFADDGNSRVFTELIIDCEHGITDEQLMLHISAAISTSLDLFKTLDEAFPGLQETEAL